MATTITIESDKPWVIKLTTIIYKFGKWMGDTFHFKFNCYVDWKRITQ